MRVMREHWVPPCTLLVLCCWLIAVNCHFITRLPLSAVKSPSRDAISFTYQTELSTRRKGAMEMSLRKRNFPAPKIIIAGAPAAGKGTQCEMIKLKLGLIHLSTGEILRTAVKEGTPLGIKAKAFMDEGQLVPDDLVIGVICDRLQEKDCETSGWLLDGFPRTKSQAEALAALGIIPDTVLLLDVPEDILVERVTGRRTDPATGKIYHMKFNPPENDEVASRLVQRSDDTAEKITIRYKEFQSHIEAIKSCYEEKIVLVDGTVTQSEVSKCIANALDASATLRSKQSVATQDSKRAGTPLLHITTKF